MIFFVASFANAYVEYKMIHFGTCREFGLEPVVTTTECEQAATALDLRDKTVSTTSKTQRPEGCYYTNPNNGRSLWFGKNGVLGSACCDNYGYSRKAICKAAYPTDVVSVSVREFVMLEEAGRCADHGMIPVVDQKDCAYAAEYLDLRDKTVSTTSNSERPRGCYYTNPSHGSSLWFAANGAEGYSCCNEYGISRKPICEMPIDVPTAEEEEEVLSGNTWTHHADTNIPDDAVFDDGNSQTGTGSDLVACFHSGDIRSDAAKLLDCKIECERIPECVAIVAHPWGTMLKDASAPRVSRSGFDTYTLARN